MRLRRGIGKVGDKHVIGGADIEWPFIVDIVRHSHQGVGSRLAKSLYIGCKRRFLKDGIDCSQDEGGIGEPRTECPEAVHRTGRGSDHVAQGDLSRETDRFQISSDCRHLWITDNGNLRGVVGHKDAQQPVYQRLTTHPDEGFGTRFSFLHQSRAITRGQDCIFHSVVFISRFSTDRYRCHLNPSCAC